MTSAWRGLLTRGSADGRLRERSSSHSRAATSQPSSQLRIAPADAQVPPPHPTAGQRSCLTGCTLAPGLKATLQEPVLPLIPAEAGYAERHAVLTYERSSDTGHVEEGSNAVGKLLQELIAGGEGRFKGMIVIQRFIEGAGEGMKACEGRVQPELEKLLAMAKALKPAKVLQLSVVCWTLDRFGHRIKKHWQEGKAQSSFKEQVGTHIDVVLDTLHDAGIDIVTATQTEIGGPFDTREGTARGSIHLSPVKRKVDQQ